MRVISRWIFWLIFAKIAVCLAYEEFFILSGPEYDSNVFYSYTYHKQKDAFCITNETGVAISWNENLDWVDPSLKGYNKKHSSIVRYNNHFVYPLKDHLTCQLNKKSQCSQSWDKQRNWDYVTSLTHPMRFVTDNRWEDFQEFEMTDRFSFITPLPLSGSIAVSIRGKSDAHFALCTEYRVSSFCFFVILGGWSNNKSVIRKCPVGIPEPASNFPQGECANAVATFNGTLLSSTEWKHFQIKWSFERNISLSVYDSNSEILNYEDSDYFTNYGIQKIYLFSRNEYLLATATKSKLLSPKVMPTSPDRNVCVEMSISICKKCLLMIDFEDNNNHISIGATFHHKISDLPNLTTWQSVKLNKTLPANFQLPIRLRINTLNTLSYNNYQYQYWAISNVRRCYDDTYKVASIRLFQDYSNQYFWPNVTCQKISMNDRSRIIDSSTSRPTNLNAEKRDLCPKGKIGRSCLVTCSEIFHENEDCKKLITCDESGCSCGQGFTMPTCDEECPALTYGFECKKTCGNCSQNACDPFTGDCLYGCQNTDSNYFIEPVCKDGVGSPSAPNVELINSTSVRIFLEIRPEYTTIQTSINFEVWANKTSPQLVTERINASDKRGYIETYAEHLSPGTHYHVLGNVFAVNKQFRGKWKDFVTPCIEFAPSNFEITSNETSITIITKHDHVNDSCPYTWYHVQLNSSKKKLFNGSYAFPKTFSGLESFTEYTIVIETSNSTILSKTVSTLEGVPDAVTALEAVDTTAYKFSIIWMPPNKTRGKIMNYTVKIEAVQSIGCNDLKLNSYLPSNYKNGAKFLKQDTIENLEKTIFKYTFNKLIPYTKYQVSIYASTSRHEGDIKRIYHQTMQSELPSETFSNLRVTHKVPENVAAYLQWDPPSDCSTITGSLEAAKLSIRRFRTKNFTIHKTTVEKFLPLEKSEFDGAETYEVKLYPLRKYNSLENETAFTMLIFTIPAREPLPVRDAEIVEVDTQSKTVTLRWIPPPRPMHGTLEHYTIHFCNKKLTQCRKIPEPIVVNLNEYCELWRDLQSKLCKTVPLPSEDYNMVQIKAHNVNVTKASEPSTLALLRNEFEPNEPSELVTTIEDKENTTVKVSWNHPSRTGGKLQKFEIEVELNASDLKKTPWTRNVFFLEIDNEGYQPQYNTQINLFPSTSFNIQVRAITVGKMKGPKIQSSVTTANFVSFSSEDLKAKANDDLLISIVIPKVINDVKESVMFVVVQGPKYCDEGNSNDEDVHWLLDTQSSSYYQTAWKAFSLTQPESSENKTFFIGDGQMYGKLKNYALCPKESYIIHLVLVNNLLSLNEMHSKIQGKDILKSVKTNAVPVGELAQNYAAWLTPLFFIILIVLAFMLFLYRKRLANHFLTNKSKSQIQENMPLSNDLYKNKNNNSINEVETVTKIKEVKDFPNNSVIIVDKKKEYLMPVKVEEFGSYFEASYKSGDLEKEYLSITHGLTRPSNYGSQPENKPKNRYVNLFPYDDTRVILEKLPDNLYSDYINASYITGYGGKLKSYIATQGPKQNTIVDFWRMVWQEKVEIICMMTNLVENEKTKCEQYWPSGIGKKVLYGTISVQFSSQEIYSDYTYRKFRVHCGSQEARTIEHLHYTAWPDHGVPSNPRSIVTFLKEIQKHAPLPRKDDDPPIVVHCSAGVGRTGTLIVLDMSLCRAFSENVVDVYADTLSVRKERLNMVDNTKQYLLVHFVLAECLNSQNTYFICDKSLPEKIIEAKKNSAAQYQRILDTSWSNEVLGSPPLPEKSLSNKNRAKHRFPESAGGLNRLYLKRSVITDEDSDYIAATLVKGIFKDSQYITTQLPMPSTKFDFWRMLLEQNVEYVLVLQLPDLKNPTYCELIPETQEFGNNRKFNISLTENYQYYSKEEVIIDSCDQLSKKQMIKIVTYKNWPELSLPPPNELVKLWKFFDALPKNNKIPIVITCCNGVTISGLWLTLSFLLKRMTVDKECDVSQAVRVIQKYRKDFFNKSEYLEYLYDVALAWTEEN